MEIPVLYADDDVVIVDKPARSLVVSAPGRSEPTIVDRVGKQLGAGRVFAVHRLDYGVSGTLALARRESARAPLEQVFRRHAATRVYLALLSRMPSPAAGRIESKLMVGRDGIVRSVTDGRGDRAVTDYEVVVRVAEAPDGAVLARVELQTGRRNQIRVHFAELGCPIVGDRKYGYRAPPGGAGIPQGRVLLHAWRLAFDSPFDGRWIDTVAEPAEAWLRIPD